MKNSYSKMEQGESMPDFEVILDVFLWMCNHPKKGIVLGDINKFGMLDKLPFNKEKIENAAEYIYNGMFPIQTTKWIDSSGLEKCGMRIVIGE